MNNTKYIFIVLKERNGEYEYSHRSIHELPDSKVITAERFVRKYVKAFYGGTSESGDGGFYFFGGELFVEVSFWRFISSEDYDVLKQYL